MLIIRQNLLYEQQKEYGLTDNIRKFIAKRINSSIHNNYNKLLKSSEKAFKISNELNKSSNSIDAVKKEIERTKNRNDIHLEISRGYRKPYILIGKDGSKSIMYVPELGSTPGEISHEIGHLKNHTGENGVVAKKISSLSERYIPEDKTPGFKTAIHNKLSNTLNLIEEKNASRSGLKDLKSDSILSKKELNLAKSLQNEYNKTYKFNGKIIDRIPLRDYIYPEGIEEFNKDLLMK